MDIGTILAELMSNGYEVAIKNGKDKDLRSIAKAKCCGDKDTEKHLFLALKSMRNRYDKEN